MDECTIGISHRKPSRWTYTRLGIYPLLLISAVALCFMPNPAHAQSLGSRTLVLEVSQGASYRMKVEEESLEVLIQVSGNRKGIRSQINRWKHPLLLEALAIPKSTGDTILRLRLRRKTTVYAGMLGTPHRLILGIGAPIPNIKGLANRSVVDFHTALMSRNYKEVTKPRPPDLVGRVKTILSEPEVRPEPQMPHGKALAVGSHVLYPITLPSPPQAFPLWEPNYKVPKYLNKAQHAHIIQYYKDARDGYLKETAEAIHLELVAEPDGPFSAELRYLEASILYTMAKKGDYEHAPMTPVQRARLAYNKHPKHPMAKQMMYLTALGYAQLGFYHESSHLLRRLLEGMGRDKHPQKRAFLIAKAMADHNRGKPLLASKYYFEALKLTPVKERENIILVMAAAQLEAGRGQAGAKLIRFLQRTRSKHLKTKYFKYLLAESLYREDRFTEASKIFTELLEADPETSHAPYLQIRLGECHLMQPSLREAISYFTTPLNTANLSGPPRDFVNGIWELRQMQLGLMRTPVEGQRPFIEKLYDMRIQFPIAPLEPEILFDIAQYHHELGELDASLTRFRELLQHYPNYPYRTEAVNLVWDGFQTRLKHLHHDGETFRLLSLYEQFLPVLDSESLHDQRLFLLIAHSYRGLGLYDKAYQALSQTFFIHDQNPELRDESLLLLAALHRMEGLFPEHDDVMKYLRKRSKNSEILARTTYEEGLAFEAQGKEKQALKLYGQFIKGAPDLAESAAAWQRLGELHKKYESYGKAELAYESGLSVVKALKTEAEAQEKAALAKNARAQQAKRPQSHIPDHVGAKPKTQAELNLALDEELINMMRVKTTLAALKAQETELTYLLAESQLHQEKWVLASENFKAALTLDANHPSRNFALYSQAEALSKSGNYTAAAKIWKDLSKSEDAANSIWSRMAEHMLTHSKWENQNL